MIERGGLARLLCILHLPPPVHGVTRMNELIVRSRVLAQQFEIEVVPLQLADTLEELGRFSGRKLRRAAGTVQHLVRALASRRVDAAYLSITPSGFAFYRDCLHVALLRAAGIPTILHLHAQGIGAQAQHRPRLCAWLFEGASLIHLSPALRHETRGLIDEERVRYVPNGIPDDNPAGRLASSDAAIPRILFLSNLLVDKGPLVLLDALAELQRRGIAFEATFAGAPARDLDVAGFEEARDRLGLRQRVRYSGPVHGEEKTRLLATHDVFAFPTLRDAFPLVVLEAMQHGLPIVATREGGIPDMVEHDATGYLVARADVGGFADRLATLLTDPALRARMGRAGRARFVEHFTLARFEAVLASALASCIADEHRVRDASVRGHRPRDRA